MENVTIEFTREELQVLVDGLAGLPYRVAAPVVNKVIQAARASVPAEEEVDV